MIRWFKYGLAGVLCMLLGVSCYRDKGNYSYEDLNEITIDLPDQVAVQQGMLLEVEPKLLFALEENEENLSYEWVITVPTSADSVNVVLSTNRNFSERIDYSSGNIYPFSFKVTDNNTGVTYRKGLSLEVRTNYQPGYFVLEQDGEHSDISFYNTGINEVFHNVFSEVNPEIALKSKAIDLFSVDYEGFSSPDGKVAAGNMTMLFGEDWGYVIDYRSCRVISGIEQMFMTAPAVIRPQVLANNIEQTSTFVLINDGKIYRMYQSEGQTVFGEPLLAPDGSETACASFIGSGVNLRGLMGVLYFDEGKHRFYSRYQATNTTLNDVTGTYVEGSDTLFYANKVNEDWELIGMPQGGMMNTCYYMVFKAPDGIHTIKYDMAGGGFNRGPLHKVTEEDAPGMGDSPCFAAPPMSNREQVYYANGNEIRLYDVLANTSRAIHTFPEGEEVAFIVFTTNGGLSLTAATNNGSKGSIYTFELSHTGDVQAGPELLATDFGKIKKLVYKK